MTESEREVRPVLGRLRRAAHGAPNTVRRALVVDGQLDRVQAGRMLLVAQGLLVIVFANALGASAPDVVWLALISLGMAGLLGYSFVVPWSRMPSSSPVAFALVSIGAFVALGLSTATTFAPVTGVLTLTMVYAGLTQPFRVAAALVPLGGVALAVNYLPITDAIIVRTIVAMSVWLVTVSALCWLTRTNQENAAQLRASAFVDALTGLPNRRDLDLRLEDHAADEMIVLLDLDHFKIINDTAGHSAGDAVLRRFGTLLQQHLRTTDYCARLGGEEFVIIFGPATAGAHRAVLDRLHAQWRRMNSEVTFSSGSARGRVDRSARETMAVADRALYLAKNEGRNTDRSESDLPAREVYEHDAVDLETLGYVPALDLEHDRSTPAA